MYPHLCIQNYVLEVLFKKDCLKKILLLVKGITNAHYISRIDLDLPFNPAIRLNYNPRVQCPGRYGLAQLCIFKRIDILCVLHV